MRRLLPLLLAVAFVTSARAQEEQAAPPPPAAAPAAPEGEHAAPPPPAAAPAAPEGEHAAPPTEHGAPAHGAPAHAVGGHEEHHEINWFDFDYKEKGLPPPFGAALINFLVFAAILYKIGAKPLREFIANRHETIRKDLDDAANLRNGAQAMLEEYGKKVKNADEEIAALLEGIRKEAEAEKARIIAAAEAEAARLKSDAERQVAAEIERARTELRSGVIEAAVAAAEKILKEKIGADDQRKLAERYVVDLEKRPAGRAS